MLKLSAPFKVAVLCSHRAPGLVDVLSADHRRGKHYDVVCCVTSSDDLAGAAAIHALGVPVLSLPVRSFCRARGASLCDMTVRTEYDAAMVELLGPYNPDLVLLDGYLLLLTVPMLERFEGRIVNVHHADLTLRDAAGLPRYPGLRAVRDALFAGALETRATAHVVTEGVDDGPVLLRSWPFHVPPLARWAYERQAHDVLRAYAWAHQEWMLREAWPVMLSNAIALAGAAFAGTGRPLDVPPCAGWVALPNGSVALDRRITSELVTG